MTNKYSFPHIDSEIESKNIKALTSRIKYVCACVGNKHDINDHLCLCERQSKYIRDRISWFALQRGEVIKLKTD